MQHFSQNVHLIQRHTLKPIPVEALIKASLSGDPSAQKTIFDRLAGKMMSVCMRYMGDRDSAQDVLQDGFITLFSKLGDYSGQGSFEGWARKIFVNTALMALRKNDVLKESSDIDAAFSLSSSAPSAGDKLGYDELMRLVGSLPAGFRTVFNMYVIEGYSHKEIGEALGISEATSRSQLQRARIILQEKIKNLDNAGRR